MKRATCVPAALRPALSLFTGLLNQALLLVALCALVALVGCGGGETEEEAPPPPPPGQPVDCKARPELCI